jgi:hypothetical protein
MDGLESSPLATAALGRPGATIGPAHPTQAQQGHSCLGGLFVNSS